MRRRSFSLWAAAAGIAARIAPAIAADTADPATGDGAARYPWKPVRLVVPLQPGGPTDFAARTVARELGAALGQPVVVDNRPGADGLIAAREVMAAEPDGHTLLFATGSMLALPLLAPPPAFDWTAAFAPVGRIGRLAFCLAIHPQVPAATVAEFVAYARAQPGTLSFASSTLGELMVASQFMQAAGVPMTRVPYKGGAQAMPDLLAGRVQVMFGPTSLLAPQAQAGALRVLATLGPQRSAELPDVPTMREAGYPAVTVPTWQAVFAPAKTPPAVVVRLAAELATLLDHAALRGELAQRAVEVDPAGPQALAAAVAAELRLWPDLVARYRPATH
jgi:tripartite-type tricarboxylate transporter receptor subunit TctC